MRFGRWKQRRTHHSQKVAVIRRDDRQTQRCPVGSRFQFICPTLALPTRPVAAPCLPPSAGQSLPELPLQWPAARGGGFLPASTRPPVLVLWAVGGLLWPSRTLLPVALWRGCWRVPGVNETVRSGPCPAHSRSCEVSSCWEHLLACSRHRPGVCTGANQLTPRLSCESGAAINPIYRVTDRLLGWNIQNC